tara:strand:- start:737 stop:979 length:243 start_codon:yes stop_codon:yes gene_type:complete
MNKKEAFFKSIIWRFFVAIPFSTIITYFYLDSAYEAIELSIVVNIVATILYYLFDLAWFRWFSDRFNKIMIKTKSPNLRR